MRRFAVAAFVLSLLSLIGAGAAMAATTTVTGTYTGPTMVSGGCIDAPGVWNGTHCDFDGTGYMTGTTGTGDPWVAGYQAHLDWTPNGGCSVITGDVWFAPGWVDPAVSAPADGVMVATLGPGSQACTTGFSVLTPWTVHLEGTISGMGIGPWQDATGTFTRDGTLVFPGADNGTFSVSYTVPDPPPPVPTSAEQCKKNGWQTYGIFKNQGDCVSYVATHGKNEPGKNNPK